VEIDATNTPGLYRLDIPDAAFATGADVVTVMLKGAANMAPVLMGIPLTTPYVRKNQALDNVPFLMIDASTGLPMTGLTVTAERSIDGAAFAACANSVAELSAGVYVIDLAASDLNGTTIIFKFTATGAKARYITIITQE